MTHLLDSRPIIVAVAGPNGAGKSTFYEAFLSTAGLRYVNADELARTLGLDAYAAASAADHLRRALVASSASFVFETVFSDPRGDKIAFLSEAERNGYTVVLCFIGLDDPSTSETRVTMRVMQGGHDVPSEKIYARFPRSLSNLERAIRELPNVWIYDNSDLRQPFRKVAQYEAGKLVGIAQPLPPWLDFIEAP